MFEYDVFISYSSKDRSIVHGLAERLKQDGLQVWLDKWIIKPGDFIPKKIQEGLDISNKILMCMSPTYFESEWGKIESYTLLFDDPTNMKRRLIPLLIEDCTRPKIIAPIAYIDWRTRSDEAYGDILESCSKGKEMDKPDMALLDDLVHQIRDLINGEQLLSDEKILSCVVSRDTRSKSEGITLTFGKEPYTSKAFISLVEINKNKDDDLLTNLLDYSSLAQAFNLKTYLSFGKSLHTLRRPLPSNENLKALHKNTVTTTRTSEVLRRLQDECDIALIGQSASGKTVTAAQVATSLFMQGWTVSWLELSEPERDLTDLFLFFIRTSKGKACKHLIVLDDIQSNPSEATRIFQLINCLKFMTNSSLVMLVVGWDTATNLIKEAFQNIFVMSCKGEELLIPISRKFPQDNLNEKSLDRIRSISDGNLLIAKLAFQNLATTGEVPSRQEIAASAYKHLTANSVLTRDAVRLLYQLSALGQFEIEASRAFAEDISEEGLNELLRLGIIRLNGEFLSIGHRSLANMFVFYFDSTIHKEFEDIPTPEEIAVEYLRKAGDKQILATLELLELENTLAQNIPIETSFLVRVWTSFNVLVNYLAKQNNIDPTWGDNIAKAAFAANAFAELSHDEWFSTAKFIRSRWSVPDNGDLPFPLNEPTGERADFDEIYKRMKEEDKIVSLDSTQIVGADTIDLDKFHRTWILGILLGFEGVARKPDYKILDALKYSASVALEPEGSFYPSRVPWITARVLLGLCEAGESIRTSEIIRKSCNWLRRSYPEGPYHKGFWESGTGTWNTDIMTTAMCVSALVRSGVSVNDTAVKEGITYLLSKRSYWIIPGRELDGALAMEAVLLVRGHWREIGQELSHTLSWASSSEPWTHIHLLASETQCESVKVPQIASSLINIVWETVKTELPLLFEGMSIDDREDKLFFWEKYDFDFVINILKDCLDKVEKKIDVNIDDREVIIPKFKADNIIKELNMWKERDRRFNEIKRAFSSIKESSNIKDPNLNNLIEKLDFLGLDCFGESWDYVEKCMELSYNGT